MKTAIQLLDCTLRDGAYITGGDFGAPCIQGIIKKCEKANIDVIECGWLKNDSHKEGSSYYHVPSDMRKYCDEKDPGKTYVVMIDWDRYDLSNLPVCDSKSIDAIRVVFPHGKFREGVAVAAEIKQKGYKVFLQAANTLAYSDEDLVNLAQEVNSLSPVALSVVDTFGAMYPEDLERIINILDRELNAQIALGFHSHNNLQLSFSLCIHFATALFGKRNIMIDSSLCGMGRGAGNAPTELVANFLNQKYHKNYDMNEIFDAIDMYMPPFQEKYIWGYSTPNCIAGMFQCHVNNIAYLLKNHRTNSRDMHNIIDSLSVEDRRKYDYDLLETKYLDNQAWKYDDAASIEALKKEIAGKNVLLIGPGKTTRDEYDKITEYIKKNDPIVIFVNALNPLYEGDFLFLISTIRYDYAEEVHGEQFKSVKKILLSNIKRNPLKDEYIVNYESVIKRGWMYFDNAIITCMRLMNRLSVKNVGVAGLDQFLSDYNESYADPYLPTLTKSHDYKLLNQEIQSILNDFVATVGDSMNIEFVTTTVFKK
jgi:4-hydroxy 2-oxovalerate aldolase